MKNPLHTFQIAICGLDLLHQTRLRLASSMLLAERIDVVLQPWQGQPIDLLVVGEDQLSPATPLAQAHAQGIPTLMIARRIATGAAGQLPHGASVRDINRQLSALLLAVAEARHEQSTPPLLLQLTRNAPRTQDFHLLRRGAMTLVVDSGRRSIALAKAATLAGVVMQLDHSSWSTQALDASTFAHEQSYRLPQRCSFEALHFCIARYRPELLPAHDPQVPLQLRQWPDLCADDVPDSWLLAIACLHARPWPAHALAGACQIPHDVVQSLFSAAHACGLAMNREHPMTHPQRERSSIDSRFLSWVARRFGLTLFNRVTP
ncbi:hypothetical protein [Stenotrophomonas sp. NA06056]|uniref:hypothetical protein n=1 Tax=Stenotrophomonas sp. NA06056 TaxID=2742129 RepID=UPI00158F314F|nr:hypothetical protein [Stenotrophomonas sp. NA06056]QKW55398.1 hypothetical protein HUT07_01805 [Stenotrophomonas sp. NA06056]